MSATGPILLADLRDRRRARQEVDRAERAFQDAQYAALLADIDAVNAMLERRMERYNNYRSPLRRLKDLLSKSGPAIPGDTMGSNSSS